MGKAGHRAYLTTPQPCQNAYRKVLLLQWQRVPGSWYHVCPKRLQGLPVLQLKVPQELQDEAQPTQGSVDQGVPQGGRQGDDDRLYPRIREAASHPCQVRPRARREHRCCCLTYRGDQGQRRRAGGEQEGKDQGQGTGDEEEGKRQDGILEVRPHACCGRDEHGNADGLDRGGRVSRSRDGKPLTSLGRSGRLTVAYISANLSHLASSS